MRKSPKISHLNLLSSVLKNFPVKQKWDILKLFSNTVTLLEERKAWLSNMFWSVTTYELIVSIGAKNPVNLTTWVLANWHSVTAVELIKNVREIRAWISKHHYYHCCLLLTIGSSFLLQGAQIISRVKT